MRFTICDRWGNPVDDLDNVTRAVRTRSVDGTDTLDLTLSDNIAKDDRIIIRDSMERWGEYIVQETDTSREDGTPVTTANCSTSMSILSRCWIEDRRPSGNAAECLAVALEGTGWEPGTVQAGTIHPDAAPNFYHCSVLDAIQNISETFGLEIQTEIQPDTTGNRVGRRIIHMLDQCGNHTTTKRFEYGKDLTDITRTVDPSDVVTRLYGWGKGVETGDEDTGGYGRKLDFSSVNNGLKYVEDTKAAEEWGIPGPDGTKLPSVGSVEFGDCEDPEELLRLTKDKLKNISKPTISYEANVIALGTAGMDMEGTDIGDTVQIIDTTFNQPLRLDGRILKIQESLIQGDNETTITLGNIGNTWTQRVAAQQQAIDKLVSNSGAWDSAAAGTGPYIGDVINRVNQIMNTTGGYVYLIPDQGIYIYDKPIDQEPTQAIQIGGGYWRIADKKTSNGEWDWRSLADGHGIYADTIFTGMLHDSADLNYWNLDTGEFRLSARATVGGKTVEEIAQAETDGIKEYVDQQDSKVLENADQAAKNYVDVLDESLGQKNVFDRLTNNGQTQGIYLNGGLLYINGTYIKSGVIDAALVKAGIISDKKGLCYWNLDTGDMHTTSMTATDITATGQITSTSNGTSAAIKGGTMTYSNNYGGRFQISNDRMGYSGNSWVNLIGNNVDNLVIQNETSSYNSSLYVMCGPDFGDAASLFLMYGQFASLEVDNDNQLIVSDGGVQHDSTGYYTAEVRDGGDHMVFDMGQGTNAPSRIWLGISNSYDPCLKINRNSCQISCNDLNRVDLSTSYAALVHDNYHVIVDANGVGQTTRAAAATGRQTALMEQRLMQMADEGIDLSDPSGYSEQPAAIDEIRVDQIHDILRMLVDGDTDGARDMLDQVETEQRIWTQYELDAFDAAAKTDHPTGRAEQDREKYLAATAASQA